MTLEPGDVIGTGTPEGIGPVANGQVMEASIEGLGTLRSPVVFAAEAERAAVPRERSVLPAPAAPAAGGRPQALFGRPGTRRPAGVLELQAAGLTASFELEVGTAGGISCHAARGPRPSAAAARGGAGARRGPRALLAVRRPRSPVRGRDAGGLDHASRRGVSRVRAPARPSGRRAGHRRARPLHARRVSEPSSSTPRGSLLGVPTARFSLRGRSGRGRRSDSLLWRSSSPPFYERWPPYFDQWSLSADSYGWDRRGSGGARLDDDGVLKLAWLRDEEVAARPLLDLRGLLWCGFGEGPRLSELLEAHERPRTPRVTRGSYLCYDELDGAFEVAAEDGACEPEVPAGPLERPSGFVSPVSRRARTRSSPRARRT